MSRSFSDQDLFAQFQQLNEEIPSDMAARIERKMLAEVSVTLRKREQTTAAAGSNWFAQLFDRIPKLHLAPSFAMAGAIAAIFIVVLMFNQDIRDRLFRIMDGPTNSSTGSPGDDYTLPTAEDVPTVEPTPSEEIASVATSTATETPTATTSPTATASTVAEPVQDLSSTEPESPATDNTQVSSVEPVTEPEEPTVDSTIVEDSNALGDNSSATDGVQPNEGIGGVNSATPTNTPRPTATSVTPTQAAIAQLSVTTSPTASPTGHVSAEDDSISEVITPQATATTVSNATPTAVSSLSDSGSGTVQSSNTATPVKTNTPSPTRTPTGTPTNQSNSVVPTATPSPATSVGQITVPGSGATTVPKTSTPKPTSTKTSTPKPTNTQANTPVPTETDTRTPHPTATDTNTPVPTITKTSTPKPAATSTANKPPQARDYSVQGNEDAVISFSLLNGNNISDPDNNAISIEVLKQPEHGELTVVDDSFMAEYIPAANFAGVDTLLIRATDSGGLYDDATVTIIVNPVNDKPVANADRGRGPEDGPISIDVLKNDYDPDDGDVLRIVDVGIAQHGTTRIEGNAVTYIPAPNFTGEDAFSYQIADKAGVIVAAAVEIVVEPVQDPPSPQPDSASVNEDGSIEIDVLSNDVDIDGDTLRIARVDTVTNGTVELIKDQTALRFIPASNMTGQVSFGYIVTDGHTEVPSTVTVLINPMPDAPIAVADVKATNEDVPVIISPLENDIDVDGETLTLSALLSNPNHGTASIGAGNVVTYVPARDFNGSDFFEYEVKDSSGQTGRGLITVNVTAFNQAPEAIADIRETAEDTLVAIPVLANDKDADGDLLDIQTFTQPAHGTVVVDGNVINYMPVANYNGPDTFTYTATDGRASATATVQITVLARTDMPMLTNDSVTGDEDTLIRIPVLNNDSDADGDTLRVTAVSVPGNGTATIENGQVILYQPNPNFVGADSFIYTASDGVLSQQATVQVTINNINDVPNAQDDEVVLDEDTVKDGIDVLANDTDADKDDVLSIAQIVEQPAHGTLSIVGTTLRFEPEKNFAGNDVASILITDGRAEKVTQLIIKVVEVADVPIANDDVVPGTEDTPLTINVLANDLDPDPNSVLTISGVSASLKGSVVSIANNQLLVVPPTNFNGQETFTYTIRDDQGNEDSATVTVNFDPTNDPPVAVDDEKTTEANMPLLVDARANDIDVETPVGQLTIVDVGQPQPGSGSVTIENGQIRYTPAVGFSGKATITYTISDGGQLTDEGLITITVNALPNVPPTATNDSAAASGSAMVAINVLANDVDPDNGPQPLSVRIVVSPTNGIARVVNNVIQYTANAGYVGPDSITYNISDGQATSQNAVITIDVKPVDQPPEPTNDSATTQMGQEVVINVLSNDNDPNGDVLSLIGIGQPGNGIAQPSGIDSILYTPNPGFIGADTFTYTVAANSLQSQATVVVTVESVAQSEANQPPVAVADTAQATAGQAVTIPVLNNDVDPEGAQLTIVDVIPPVNGQITIVGSTIVFTPSTTYSGTVGIQYTVSDGDLNATALISVIVNAP